MSAQLTGPDAAPSAGVLGPVRAVAADGTPLPLHGPRHAEVLARLIAAGGRVVPVPTLGPTCGRTRRRARSPPCAPSSPHCGVRWNPAARRAPVPG
ncbi:hypothetical protein [Nocardia africana]|uniref:hypothetical protein n=1 Tax=Nocardia africana TaxID=134964 RepID=UPI000FE1CA48|nr:hypothetical protein [Nocardia africana]